MKTLSMLALAATLPFVALSGAQAATMYTDPDACIADYGKLDTNGDGFTDNTEMSEYARVEQNVDVDGDGKYSAEERTVACKEGRMSAFSKPYDSGSNPG
ncbi:MAG: hypothetical protein AAGJ53_09270 [Pseudomonadota bacterium]